MTAPYRTLRNAASHVWRSGADAQAYAMLTALAESVAPSDPLCDRCGIPGACVTHAHETFCSACALELDRRRDRTQRELQFRR